MGDQAVVLGHLSHASAPNLQVDLKRLIQLKASWLGIRLALLLTQHDHEPDNYCYGRSENDYPIEA